MKMYVLVRKDLTNAQQAVQGGHALAQFILNNNTDWNNGTLVYLGVRDEVQLMKQSYKLKLDGINVEEWREPDMDNQLTAIATYTHPEILKSVNCI